MPSSQTGTHTSSVAARTPEVRAQIPSPVTGTILRHPAVERLTGLSRSTIYNWMAQGIFPKPVQLGPRAVGWRESDILGWLESRQPRMGAA